MAARRQAAVLLGRAFGRAPAALAASPWQAGQLAGLQTLLCGSSSSRRAELLLARAHRSRAAPPPPAPAAAATACLPLHVADRAAQLPPAPRSPSSPPPPLPAAAATAAAAAAAGPPGAPPAWRPPRRWPARRPRSRRRSRWRRRRRCAAAAANCAGRARHPNRSLRAALPAPSLPSSARPLALCSRASRPSLAPLPPKQAAAAGPDPYARPARAAGLPASLTLYQYVVCPYCCKVKAALDYYRARPFTRRLASLGLAVQRRALADAAALLPNVFRSAAPGG